MALRSYQEHRRLAQKPNYSFDRFVDKAEKAAKEIDQDVADAEKQDDELKQTAKDRKETKPEKSDHPAKPDPNKYRRFEKKPLDSNEEQDEPDDDKDSGWEKLFGDSSKRHSN